MVLRIPLWRHLPNSNFTIAHHVPWARTFATSPSVQASATAKKRKHRDPYAMVQAKARKAANLSRREELRKDRAEQAGDPVRGVETPYVQGFDNLDPQGAQAPSQLVRARMSVSQEQAEDAGQIDKVRNFFVHQDDLDRGLQHSNWLATPSNPAEDDTVKLFTSEQTPEDREAAYKDKHDTASEALRRITSLTLGSSKDRLRIIKQQCIADFGRHNTDKFLPPKPVAADANESQPQKTPSAGPDTGSSEVQIAILTAKIRTLADFLQSRGTQDKVNKRNLRLLVHRRQKLLRYLHRKERGGPRWKHVVETLGLSEGTWKGEISL